MSYRTIKRLCSFLLSILMIVSVLTVSVMAEDTQITESSTYVLDRDGNGEHLYRYQSPCMIGYDFNNENGGNGIPIQAFVFTMYNSFTQEHFPTYCSDINVTAVQGADYRRLNLEDSPFSGSAAGQVRAILQKGFYIIPIDGETDEAHEARVNAKAAEIAKAAGLEELTVGEAIAATQAAIWQVVHGPSLSYPKFCRYVFNPRNTKYGSLCSYSVLKSKDTALINTTIETVYDYLLSLEPVAATHKTVSPSSFVSLHDPVLTPNTDGTYQVSVTTTVDVDMASGDTLTLKASLSDSYSAKAELADGTQNVTLTLENVPAAKATGEVTLSISGYQTGAGYFYFDAVGDRSASQAMVGYNNSRLPVYAEVTATESRVLNIYKSTSLEVGDDSYERRPLGNIVFDIFPVATMDEYLSGAVELPEATEYNYPDQAEYTLITNKEGKASLNFTHHGLEDGVYLIVEQNNPSIVKPIDPFYLIIPMTSADGSDLVYEITIKPKNDIKSSVQIEKDVISIGNDEATVNAYEDHTWIIGATIPEDIASGESYVITDTLDNRLDYIGNVKVNLEKKDGSADPVELTAGTDYKLTVTDVDSLTEEKPSDSFEIQLTGSGMSNLATTIGDNSFGDYILRIYFDAQINANAQMGTEIPNQAQLEYVNAAKVEFKEESDIPKVTTGGINLLKVDAKNNSNLLSGAVFEVYRNATWEEVNGADSQLTEISGVSSKVVKMSFFDNAAMEGEKVTSATSDADGKVAIYGLAYGQYYLVETQAPEGYNPLRQPIELTIDATSHEAENVITIKNESGNILPATGGMGTTVYTVGGTILLCTACLFLYLNKRKNII